MTGTSQMEHDHSLLDGGPEGLMRTSPVVHRDIVVFDHDGPRVDLGMSMQFIAEYGTPVMIYSVCRMADNANAIRQAFVEAMPGCVIAYAYKACYFPQLTGVFAKHGLWTEVGSVYELNLALSAGFPPSRIIFNALGIDTSTVLRIQNDGVAMLHVSTFDDLNAVLEAGRSLGRAVRVGLRLNPGIDRSSFCEPDGKLGFDISSGAGMRAAESVCTSERMTLSGLHIHASSNAITVEPHVAAVRSVVEFARRIEDVFGLRPEHIDIGGGFESECILRMNDATIGHFASAIASELMRLGYAPRVVVEPGRYLIADAGVVLTRIVAEKRACSRRWLFVDAGTNLLIPLDTATYVTMPLVNRDQAAELTDIGDCICSPRSVISHNASVPSKVSRGDPLAILNCGAYTTVLAHNWMYPVPQILAVENGMATPILSRKTVSTICEALYGVAQS